MRAGTDSMMNSSWVLLCIALAGRDARRRNRP
jgi:hypothetical protein